jgi:hypothetical protein
MDQRSDQEDESRDREELGALAIPDGGRRIRGQRVDQPAGISDQPDLDAGVHHGERKAGRYDGAKRPELVDEERPDTGRRCVHLMGMERIDSIFEQPK